MATKKIFIVDDDAFLLDMYALKFSQAGHEVATALGPVPALEKLRAGYAPDIILMDVVMPAMDGFEFMEAMRKEKLAPNAAHIVLSNRGQESDVERMKSLGAIGYVVKASTTPAEVLARVEEMLAKQPASP